MLGSHLVQHRSGSHAPDASVLGRAVSTRRGRPVHLDGGCGAPAAGAARPAVCAR
jgi:hypothetical protein